MIRVTRGPEREMRAAYKECLPLAEKTNAVMNGLMIDARPVVLGLTQQEGIGDQFAYRASATYRATRSHKLDTPPVRMWQVALRDEHEPGKRRTDATILSSTVTIYSDHLSGSRTISDAKSQLTWGYAGTDLLPKHSHTHDGVGSFDPELFGDRLGYYTPEELRADYAESYVTRVASGLLVARMIDGFSAALGGDRLDLDTREEQALALVEDWSAIDEAAATQTWSDAQQLQQA